MRTGKCYPSAPRFFEIGFNLGESKGNNKGRLGSAAAEGWLIDWLIDWLGFYAVSAKFQSCNGGATDGDFCNQGKWYIGFYCSSFK